VPLGAAGEIYIGGDAVARGYLRQPELTAQRFVADPFSTEHEARLYKTGDLGRWCADGTLEYLGRNDDQVKVRGFRIELGEIEAQLVRHKQVKEAAVIVREDTPGDRRLAAYVTLRDATGPTAEELRAHMQAVLPEHMVPSAFVILEGFPLSPNGKLNRRALPMPATGAYVSRQYDAPQGAVEETVAGIWRELLRVERVGRQDNFFELGGHSILATQLMVRIRSAFSVEISMSVLFEVPTLRQLSSHVHGLRKERLLQRLADGGNESEELLARVASMSDNKVRELAQRLRMGGKVP
jgi:acyl carrier protein